MMKLNNYNMLFALIGAFAVAIPLGASAAPITKVLTVNVFDVCDGGGANCASTGPITDTLFSTETNKIWAQAGITVSFNAIQQINSTQLSNLDESVSGDGLADLCSLAGGCGSTVDLFLVHTIAGAYGEGFLGSSGVAIAMDTVMAFNSGAGRIDTIAHELGHNLGLVPTSLGGDAGGHSPNTNYLMASGTNRLSPSSLSDIAPDGLGYDFLPQDQIDLALSSRLLRDAPPDVPEPASLALTGMALAALGALRLRRRA